MGDRVHRRLASSLMLAGVLAGACSRDNPAYEGTSADATTDGETSATSAVETDEASATSTEGTSVDTTGPPASQCEDLDYTPIRIRAVELPGTPLVPTPDDGCVGEQVFEGGFSLANGRLELCESCLCQDATVAIDLEGSGSFPPYLEGCGAVILREGALADEPCAWTELVVFATGNNEPSYVASNHRVLPGLDPLLVPMELFEACTEEPICNGSFPGTYQLVLGKASIPPGSPPQDTTLGITPYRVTNHMAMVTEACDEHIAFTAERLPRG